MTTKPRPHRDPAKLVTLVPDWRWTVGLAAYLVLVAWWALPRTIQGGDAGEFTTVMLLGGVPHPSGYPWMRLLGWVARPLWTLGVPPVMAAALPCALAGVAGWVWLERTLTRWLLRPKAEADADADAGLPAGLADGLSTFVVALVASSPVVVVHVNDAEVWGPLVFFAAWVMHECTVRRSSPLRLGLVFGLATSHHLTATLLLPLVVSAAWPRPFSAKALVRAGLLGVAGGLVGLLPYATLAIAPEGAWSWGETGTLEGLVHHVIRADYGVTSLSLHTERPSPVAQLARVSQSVGGALTGNISTVPAASAAFLVVIGAVGLRHRPPNVDAGQWWGLAGTFVVTAVAFPVAHNIDPTNPFGAWILERFDILTLVIAGPWMAAAIHPLLRRSSRRLLRVAWGVCGVALVARAMSVTLARGLPSDNPMIQRYAVDVLRTPDPDRPAVILGTDDHRTFPILFAQEVLGEGSEVVYIDASLLTHPWYREHLRRRFEALPEIDKPLRMLGELWEQPEFRDWSFYLTNDFSGPSTRLPRVPQGVLWRILPPWELQMGPAEVVQRNREALERYRHEGTISVRPGHPFASDLAAAYIEKAQSLAQALRQTEADAGPAASDPPPTELAP